MSEKALSRRWRTAEGADEKWNSGEAEACTLVIASSVDGWAGAVVGSEAVCALELLIRGRAKCTFATLWERQVKAVKREQTGRPNRVSECGSGAVGEAERSGVEWCSSVLLVRQLAIVPVAVSGEVRERVVSV